MSLSLPPSPSFVHLFTCSPVHLFSAPEAGVCLDLGRCAAPRGPALPTPRPSQQAGTPQPEERIQCPWTQKRGFPCRRGNDNTLGQFPEMLSVSKAEHHIYSFYHRELIFDVPSGQVSTDIVFVHLSQPQSGFLPFLSGACRPETHLAKQQVPAKALILRDG